MNATVEHIIKEHFKTKPVEKAWVFGSFALAKRRPTAMWIL